MLDLGYLDKNYLSKYDLDVRLFDKYNFKVYDVIPVRKAYMLITKSGNKILKKIDYTLEEFKFIVNALEYVKRNFTRVIEFEKNLQGDICTKWNGELYCIMNMVDGKECEFSNPVELAIAARGIGELHKASEGFRDKTSSKYVCGNLITSLNRKKEEMMFFKNMANLYENKSEFDDIFLKNVNSYINKIEDSIGLLNKNLYYKLCSEEDKIALCHHDLAHHNVIIKEDNAYFIDFDFAVIDLKIHDICNFINKVIKSFSFDIDKVKIIIENYRLSNTLNNNEINILYSMLTFPQDFYEISKDYYTRRKEWDERVFVSKLDRKIKLEDDRVDFLSDFNKKIKI
ncbi:spore coat protein, CotS family [Clostridium acidisoli DSM 12555]|uniref:Spore coat protein, CotS family n=1 Tax=Clostridium acidisoli DSM 12555 TaxID=1121291 RepID=A0A1W1XY27_9CLOT|nr:CotS family spore coat protein [Clostridium acidisoli]SMC28826.1 spore coat protein, CotS family [Clostridium acidisoli DSM 12555]